jgi:hypothetical protein
MSRYTEVYTRAIIGLRKVGNSLIITATGNLEMSPGHLLVVHIRSLVT